MNANLRALASNISEWTSNHRAYFDAAREVGLSVLLSTLPLWFAPILAVMLTDTRVPYTTQLYHSVRSGELFLYSAATLGPIAYVLFSKFDETPFGNSADGRRTTTIPAASIFGIMAIVVALFSGGGYGLLRLKDLDIISFSVNEPNILLGSGIIYIISVLSLYTILILRNRITSSSASTLMLSKTEEFEAAWEEARGDA